MAKRSIPLLERTSNGTKQDFTARTPAPEAHPFFSLNAKYQITAGANPDDLLEDTMSFLSCARGILQGFLSENASSEELFGISFLLEMACNTLSATQEFSFAAIDEQAVRIASGVKGGAA